MLGLAVWGHAAMLAWRVERSRGEVPELVPSARRWRLVVMLQVVLGVASWWMLRPFDGIPRTVTIIQAMVRTGHQANGAFAPCRIVGFDVPSIPAPGPSGRRAEPVEPVCSWFGGSRLKPAVSLVRQGLAESSAETAMADVQSRLAAYATLAKLRVAVLVLATVAAGFVLGARGSSHPSHTFADLARYWVVGRLEGGCLEPVPGTKPRPAR